MTQENWYKVLVNGQSDHGGNLTWNLPIRNTDGSWEPGEWHEVEGRIAVCHNGLHITTKPTRWMKPGADVYLAEHEGDTDTDGDDKIAARRVRLLRPLTSDELAAMLIFQEGEHAVSDGIAWASGSATVEASGSATVRASGSATVEASGSATVEASDSATVRASGSATVRASGSATVEASGSATVRAWGSATVRAWDSATVRAWDSATVRAWDSATVEASDSATVRASDSATATTTPWYRAQTIAVDGYAVWIDRRSGAPRVVVGGVEYAPKA